MVGEAPRPDEAVDENIPEPVRDTEKPFLMPIEDVFTITGRGTVVTGKVERGVLKTNETVEIVGIKEKSTTTTVTAIEMFRKTLDEAMAGENCGLLLRGIKREDVERGQVVVKPGSITPHTNFEANVYILSKDEGGRHTPFYDSYRPQFYFRTTDVTGVVKLPEGTEMVMPGDNTEMSVELIQPIAWRTVCSSPSVRVAGPSARAASPRSSSSTHQRRQPSGCRAGVRSGVLVPAPPCRPPSGSPPGFGVRRQQLRHNPNSRNAKAGERQEMSGLATRPGIPECSRIGQWWAPSGTLDRLLAHWSVFCALYGADIGPTGRREATALALPARTLGPRRTRRTSLSRERDTPDLGGRCSLI